MAQGEAECNISLKTMPECYISCNYMSISDTLTGLLFDIRNHWFFIMIKGKILYTVHITENKVQLNTSKLYGFKQ